MDHKEIDSSKLKSLPVPDLLSIDKKADPKVSKHSSLALYLQASIA